MNWQYFINMSSELIDSLNFDSGASFNPPFENVKFRAAKCPIRLRISL